MGIDVDLEIEGEEGDQGVYDARIFAYIMQDLSGEDDNSILVQIAWKNNIDLTPFQKKFPQDDSGIGPWFKPGKLKKSARALYKAVKAEGDSLIGSEICYNKIEDRDDLKYYRKILLSVVTQCRQAKKEGKKVRWIIE